MSYQERYSPIVLAANATALLTGSAVGGFICKTAGTISISKLTELGVTVLIVDAVPVTAGVYLPIPLLLGPHGGSVTLAGGASGTLGVA